MHRPRLLASALAAACILAVPAAPAVAAVPNSWTPTVTPSADRYAAAAALLPGHRVLVAGGFDAAGNGLRSAEVYDPAANNWSRAADMGAARAAATATALADGRVLVTGGVPDSTGVATAQNTGEVYDPATNAWTPVLNPMSVKRLEHVAVLLSTGKVLIAGGTTTTAPTASVDLYDPGTNTFVPAPSMGAARSLPGIARLSNGKVLVAGGSPAKNSGSATGDVYDPEANTWTATANSMSGGARFAPAEAGLPGGRALVAGGATKDISGTVSATADVYDTVTNSFAAVGNSMSSARWVASAMPLGDGRILVAGGASSQVAEAPAANTADLFSPASGTFTPAASMTAARFYAAAAPLDDGRVLLAGGSSTNRNTSALASAEVYQPTTGPGAPGSLGASPGIGAALLTWGVPAFDGGAAIERYRIAISPGGPTIDTPDARLTTRVTGLRNGQAYTFTVTGINAIGLGIPSPPTVPVTPTRRILTRLAESPASFRAATSGPSARAGARRRTPKPGTTVRFTLIEPGTVTFTVEHAVRGHGHGRRCVAGRRGRGCTRYLRVRGSFRRTGRTGSNRFRFTARIGGRKLASGSYRLVATPREVTGRLGTAVRVGFHVKR